MNYANLLGTALGEIWPDFPNGHRWVSAQVQVESGGDPDAVSPVGAVGLLQLMPATAAEMGVANPRDPLSNLRGGVRYLKIQYDHFPEIPDENERLKFSFGAYNGGRGYINRALSIARLEGEKEWMRWRRGSLWLMHRSCRIDGRYPDHRQIWQYVERIMARAWNEIA